MQKSYVNKNQYCYDVLGLIVDTENKTITIYSPCTMPTGNIKRQLKKQYMK